MTDSQIERAAKGYGYRGKDELEAFRRGYRAGEEDKRGCPIPRAKAKLVAAWTHGFRTARMNAPAPAPLLEAMK